MTANNLRRLIKLIGLQGLRGALFASLAVFFSAKKGLWAPVNAIFPYFSVMQFVFCLPGKIRGGAQFWTQAGFWERVLVGLPLAFMQKTSPNQALVGL